MAEFNQNPTEPVNYTLLDGGGVRRRGCGGYNMFRMLVPKHTVGYIIGNNGDRIDKLRRETKTRIKIFNGPIHTTESIVVVSAKEVNMALLPPAIIGLLGVHKFVVDMLLNSERPPSKLLVPAAQLLSLTGLQHTFDSIKRQSNCDIRFRIPGLSDCALEDDFVVEVVGGHAHVQRGIELIACLFRKFLVNRGLIHKIEAEMETLSSRIASTPPPSQPWIPPHQPFGFHIRAPPPRPSQLHNTYPLGAIPRPMFVQPHLGYNTSNQPAQMTEQIHIPALHADGVLGAEWGNMSYVRGLTGARVKFLQQDPWFLTLVISGTGSQIQAARQLIEHDLLAEAAGVGPPVSQSRLL